MENHRKLRKWLLQCDDHGDDDDVAERCFEGTITLAAATTCLLLGVNWVSAPPIIAAILLVPVLVLVEKRAEAPILPGKF